MKYWTCKRAPQHAAEALECLGGNGYVEESAMPRLFRQSPVNGVWEGSGNVICLDVLRALAREPDTLEAYWSEVGLADGGDSRLARAVDDLHVDLSDPATLESRARSVVERMALVFQASLLVRFAPDAVAEAFCGSRLGGAGPAPSGPCRPEPTPPPSWTGTHRCEQVRQVPGGQRPGVPGRDGGRAARCQDLVGGGPAPSDDAITAMWCTAK